MGGEEETSWLSSVISQVDKLALRIGGYEDEPPERGFSDDESDSNTSQEDEDSGDSGFEDAAEDAGDDSGFEDAIATPGWRPSTRPQSDNRVEAPEEGGGPSKSLEDMRLPRVSTADKAPSLSATPSHSSRDHLDMGDVQPSEETLLGDAPHKSRQDLASERAPAVSSADKPSSVSVTPSHSHDRFDEDNMPASDGAPPQQQGAAGGGFNPMFSTPAHSRDRTAFNRNPPLAVAPAARSAGSRRGHRDRNRSKEDLDTASTEAMRTHTAEEAAPVHASPSPSTSRPLKNINRPAGSTVKKYSYMSDTNWLKPKKDLLDAASSQPEVGAVAVAGESTAVQRSTLPTPAEETPSSGSATGSIVSTAGVAPPSAAWRNQRRPSSETEQQRGQDILDDGHATAETDSQVERLSEEALDKRARDAKADEEGLAETEAVASANFEDGLAVADSLNVDLPDDQVDANGHDEPHEGNGATQVVGADQEGADKGGVAHPDIWTDEMATIGAKRASVENGMGAEELGWMIDSPVGFAPSKRGKTLSEYPLAVMRHSARLDDAIHERQRKLGAMAAGSGSEENFAEKGGRDGIKSLENGAGDELEAVPWPDRALRPYDSPIVDTDLPARQAKELSRLGMDSQTLIVCSPFRRCLQTAGVVARTLGVAGVTVNLEVGERMDKVRKEIAELALANKEDSDATLGNSQPAPVFSYLEEEDMREALGVGVQLERIVGEQPPEEESGVEAKQRFIATIAKVREEQLREGPVLVVAHGDTLDAAGESLASQIVFEADYCAWALFDLDTHCGYVTESYGIQMIPL